jgi:hypothetical protein
MKRFTSLMLTVFVLLVGVTALANTAKSTSKSPPMHRYLVSVPHTAEECMQAISDFDEAKQLGKFEFGCKDGDHTAYAVVSAKDADAVRAMVPEKQRANAKVVMLSKFTPEQLKEMHASMH